MEAELVYVSATEAELNNLLEGRLEVGWHDLATIGYSSRVQAGTYGVVAALDHGGERSVQPLALIVSEQDQRRLLGRLATLRPEVSPLTSWCHLIGAKFLEGISDSEKAPHFAGLLASWSGLVVMEASLLSDRPAEKLNVSACLATQTFSLARALALWPLTTIEDVLERYDGLQIALRGTPGQAPRLRPALAPIWATLLALMGNLKTSSSRDIGSVFDASSAILDARRFRHQDESIVLAGALRHLPEAEILDQLSDLTPEERVRAFDHIVSEVRTSKGARHHELCFLAAYLATVAAGGKASIGLAAKLSRELPQLLGWTYFIGGLGQKITWSSAFEGLGRLVSRELSRPFRITDGPLCDFAYEEAMILLDRQLNDPLVFLKIKQARTVVVALMPGVNVMVPLVESLETNRNLKSQPQPRQSESRSDTRNNDVLSVLASALFPYIEDLLSQETNETAQGRSVKGRGLAKPGVQKKLPLK